MKNVEKVRIVERALWEGVEPKPDNEVVVKENWVQLTTPHAPTAFLNGVYRCEVDEDSVHERIQETVAHFRNLNLPFRWKIGPSSKPANLGSLLLECGLEHKETLFGLIADPKSLSIPSNPDVSVKELKPENLEDWLKVQASAWKVPPPGIAHMRLKMSAVLQSGDKSYLNFLAYYRDFPVASAALRFYPEYAYLQGAAVNPEFRRQGIYRTLLAHRLREIEKRGVPAVIHCLENTSAPICLNLGFEKVCEIYSFEPKVNH